MVGLGGKGERDGHDGEKSPFCFYFYSGRKKKKKNSGMRRVGGGEGEEYKLLPEKKNKKKKIPEDRGGFQSFINFCMYNYVQYIKMQMARI